MERPIVFDAFWFRIILFDEAAKPIQRTQCRVTGPRRRHGAVRFYQQTKCEKILNVRDRDRRYPVTLSRQHCHQVFPLQAEQRVPNRGSADMIALRQYLLSQLLSRLKFTSQNRVPNGLISCITQ